MGTKEKLLDILQENREAALSGERLALRLSVSRNAVWKAIKALEKEGHTISAVRNRGYRLLAPSDALSEWLIRTHLKRPEFFRVCVRKTVESTNTALKELAAKGEPEGLVLLAEEQSAGRGRFLRQFFSPPGSGIYLSLLLRPDKTAAEASLITVAAAAAVAETIEALCGKPARIKWVNDVFVNGKKVCGILTEAAIDLESGGLEYAVLGIGINLTAPEAGFPAELSGTAGAVFESGRAAQTRERLAAEILNRFDDYYTALSDRAYLRTYREKSLLLNQEILINNSEQAIAQQINDDGHLIVRTKTGEIKTLLSGEVSVKPAREHR